MNKTHLAGDENPPADVDTAENLSHSWNGSCYAKACQRRDANNDWTCTRAPGHRGWHVAHNSSELCAWWAQDYPDNVRLPEGL